MSRKELALGLLVGTLLCQRLDVVAPADLVRGLQQSSTPRTPRALSSARSCLAEHPLGDLRRVEVRPAANLPIEDRYQVRRSALLVLANGSRQIGEVPLLCRPTGSDEGLVAQRLAHRVLSCMGLAHRELTHRGTEKVEPCRLPIVGP